MGQFQCNGVITMFKRSVRRLTDKLKEKKGETLVETLVSLLIVVMMMAMLAGAVVTSARINKSAEDTVTTYSAEGMTAVNGVTFSLKTLKQPFKTGVNGNDFSVTSGTSDTEGSTNVHLYKSADGSFYLFQAE